MPRHALTNKKSEITNALDRTGKKILRHSEIRSMFSAHRGKWGVPRNAGFQYFLDYLLRNTQLKRVELTFPYRREVRYAWGQVSIFEMPLTLHPESYLTHYTAMYLHDLTLQVPKVIYVNREQSAKPRASDELQQDRIDAAFQRPARMSRNRARYGKYTICMINGMQTGQLGVIEIPGPDGETLRVTGVERTLIDIAVRPAYSGGVFQVLAAYRAARDKVSINRLVAFLKRLDFVYPYHQAVGFYLDKAGVYREEQMHLLRNLGIEYNFYLAHKIGEKACSKEWKLFYPKGL